MTGNEDRLPAWMTGKAKKKRTNARSAKQERDYAKEKQGRVQPGSGSSHRAPEDVVEPLDECEEGFLVQLKFTDSKGFRITTDEWRRLSRNARRAGRDPKLIIEFPGEGIRLAVVED